MPISMPQTTQGHSIKKKKKKKVAAHYLAPTAASKAMKRDKSPNSQKTVKKSPSYPKLSPNAKTLKRSETQETTGSQWIEDLPIEQLKLFFTQYRNAYGEFVVLSELTTIILQDMGIFLKTFTRVQRKSDRMLEIEEEGELEMTDGIYQSREQFDQLEINDTSTYEANSPRKNSMTDGKGVYESVQ